jgi:hypothetical protein
MNFLAEHRQGAASLLTNAVAPARVLECRFRYERHDGLSRDAKGFTYFFSIPERTGMT